MKGALSKLHASVTGNQYALIRGLLGLNLGEPLDDLDFVVPTNEYTDPDTRTLLTGHVSTGIFMDFELQNVTLDLLTQRAKPPARIRDTALARWDSNTSAIIKNFLRSQSHFRVNFIKSRLIFEGFSDGSKDVDLVSQEILLSDLRFEDFPANKRSNVFPQILRPMDNVGEEYTSGGSSPLQAEVHFRATQVNSIFCYFNQIIPFI